jgi:MFS family permease
LASGLPEVLVTAFQIQSLDAIRFIFAVQAIIVLMAALLTLFIKDSRTIVGKEERYLSKESRAKVIKFSATNLIDGFGVGMIISLFSLWFYLRFGIGIQTVGYIFTVSKVFETVAYLSASPISARLGLVRTVSFSRLAGAVSVGLMAFMPTYSLAAVMYVVRNVTQHVSIPARQSYIMAIFSRRERATGATVSDLTRTFGHTVAATLSGFIMENINTTISPLLSSVLVGAASYAYYVLFKNVKPPEEK